MDKIIENIANEVEELKNDTNRRLVYLAELLSQFAMKVGQLEEDCILYNATYKFNIRIDKQQRSESSEKKITEAELTRLAEYAYKKDYMKYKKSLAKHTNYKLVYESKVMIYYAIKNDRTALIQEEKFYS